MLEALLIVASSWPIAVMVVGVTGALTARYLVKRKMDQSHAENMDRAQGNRAVVVQDRVTG